MQIGILEPKKFSPTAISFLEKIGRVQCYNGNDLDKFLFPLNILFVRLSFNIDKNFLSNCPNLQWVCSPTTGHNHLDIDYMKSKKIKVITLKGESCFLSNVRATPEHTFGLILSLLRRYSIAFFDIRDGVWNRDKCRGEELNDNKVGIIGLGRVGYRVASYCEAFGAKVMWYDNKEVVSNPGWIKQKNIIEVIKKSRVVVLCVDYKKNQSPIIGKIEIENLFGRYFINTSRGELVDEDILLKAAQKNKFAGIALDVITNENSKNKFKEWQKLTGIKNIIITPHIGGITKESLKKTELYIVEKLKIALT